MYQQQEKIEAQRQQIGAQQQQDREAVESLRAEREAIHTLALRLQSRLDTLNAHRGYSFCVICDELHCM